MTELKKALEAERRSRRRFLKNAGTVAVTAPAVAMLLSSETKANGVNGYNGAVTKPPAPQAF